MSFLNLTLKKKVIFDRVSWILVDCYLTHETPRDLGFFILGDFVYFEDFCNSIWPQN